MLPLMHVVDHDELMRLEQHVLARAQEGGDDAGDAAAVPDHRPGGLAHEPEAAAAIDEADLGRREDLAEVARGLGKGRVTAGARAAIDADIPKVSGFLHWPMWHWQL